MVDIQGGYGGGVYGGNPYDADTVAIINLVTVDARIPTEFIALIKVTNDGVSLIEFRSTKSFDQVIPIEEIGAPTILTFPTLTSNPASIMFGIQGNTQSFQYDIPDYLETAALPGDRWVCTLTFDTLSRADWAKLSVFQVLMRGETGRVSLGPIHAPAPLGVATGAPSVSAVATVGAKTLSTAGWTHSVTGILKTGDFFHFVTPIGTELKILTADANSDSSGNAVLNIAPPIRTVPQVGTALVLQNPSCIMKFQNDKQGQIKIDPPLLGSTQFEFIEALP